MCVRTYIQYALTYMHVTMNLLAHEMYDPILCLKMLENLTD